MVMLKWLKKFTTRLCVYWWGRTNSCITVDLFSRSFSAVGIVGYQLILLLLLFCVVSCRRGTDVRNLFVWGSSAGKRCARLFVINFQFLSVISRKLQPTTTTTTTSEIKAPSFFNFSALDSAFPPFSLSGSCLFPPTGQPPVIGCPTWTHRVIDIARDGSGDQPSVEHVPRPREIKLRPRPDDDAVRPLRKCRRCAIAPITSVVRRELRHRCWV